MNLIFLNMDGVLNNESFYNQWKKQNPRKQESTFKKLFYIDGLYYIVPDLMERFHCLYNQISDCKIVWSSPWKNAVQDSKKSIKELYYKIGLPENSFLDVTPRLIWRLRVDQIFCWLNDFHFQNEIKKVAIIDSREDYNPYITDFKGIKINFFKTTNELGFTQEIADKILNYFNEPNN